MTERILTGATAIDADGVVDDAWIAIADGRITARGTGSGWRDRAAVEARDLGGRIVVPGFVDLHSHGGGGHSVDSAEEAELAGALAAHRAHGTAASLVSFVSAPLARLEDRLRAVARLRSRVPGLLGAHLEGPFLAAARRGAHSVESLLPPEPAAVDRLLEAGAGALRVVTIAPELPGALEAIRRFAEAGVVVAVGHTEADYARTREAFDAGARLLTHAFNAMPGIGHRAPGPVTAAIEDERVTIELILDGLHVAPSVARLLLRLAPGRVALVTDAMAAAASADGDYRLGLKNVTVRDGLAVLSGTTTLAGSTLTQDAALRRAVLELGLPPAAAVAAVTSVPAGVLGLDAERGRLAVGRSGDIVVLDRDWRIVAAPAV